MDEQQKDEKTEQESQETPAGAKIPIPSKEEFFRDLAKVAKP